MASMSFHTPLGVIFATADEVGICSLDFDVEEQASSATNPHLKQLKTELDAYFQGKLKTFSVPLNPHGTPFQKSVWKSLQTIPYGEQISYTQEAIKLEHPKAVRAVANANGKNPIPIIIPCHRVIAKDGGIGGYSGGLSKKVFLLELERKYR